jgi:hypothetical protein
VFTTPSMPMTFLMPLLPGYRPSNPISTES